jgi:hypothetical protein
VSRFILLCFLSFLLIIAVSLTVSADTIDEVNMSEVTGESFSLELRWSNSQGRATSPPPSQTEDTPLEEEKLDEEFAGESPSLQETGEHTPSSEAASETGIENGVDSSTDSSPDSSSDSLSDSSSPSSSASSSPSPSPSSSASGSETLPSTGSTRLDSNSLEEVAPEALAVLLEEKGERGSRSFLSEKHRAAFSSSQSRSHASRLLATLRETRASGDIKPLLKEAWHSERFLFQFDKSCDLSEIPEQIIKERLLSDTYAFLILEIPTPLVPSLLQHECVITAADEAEIDTYLEYVRELLEREAREKMQQLKLNQSSHDVIGYDEIRALLEWDRSRGAHSPLQQYVTPKEEAIILLAEGKSPEELYTLALNWLWISDMTLFEEPEKWLYPVSFLAESKGLEGNPTSFEASDCSEQANTLVSLLRASGISSKKVRVGIGEIEFEEGHSGGHAWVEIMIDKSWVVLDPTVGRFYEKGVEEREVLPYDYWQHHPFPNH